MTKHARRVLRDFEALRHVAREVRDEHRRMLDEVRAAAGPVRAAAAREWLKDVPVVRLSQVTYEPLRLGAVRRAELVSVADVLGSTPEGLRLLRGIGPHAARRLHEAASKPAAAAARPASLRVPIGPRNADAERLVVALYRLIHSDLDLWKALEFAESVEQAYLDEARRRTVFSSYERYLTKRAVATLARLLESWRPRC